MQITITARHREMSDALRARAASVVQRLGNLAPQCMEMIVVFDSEGPQQTAELRIHLRGGAVVVAGGKGVDHRTALDRAEEKVRRQVERAANRPRQARSRQANQSL
jgi:ribosomal subunit interface protein